MQGQQNEHFLELFKICGGFDANLLEVNAGLDGRDGSDRQVARKDAVHAAGDDALADAHVVVVRNVLHGNERLPHSAHRALDAGVGKHGPDTALPVGEQKHLRGIGVGPITFPTTPSGVMTPMFRRMPSRSPRSISMVRLAVPAPPPMTRAASMGTSDCACRKPSSPARRSASAAFPSSWAMRSFSVSFSRRNSSLSFLVPLSAK